jgi:hypothetical protein
MMFRLDAGVCRQQLRAWANRQARARGCFGIDLLKAAGSQLLRDAGIDDLEPAVFNGGICDDIQLALIAEVLGVEPLSLIRPRNGLMELP